MVAALLLMVNSLSLVGQTQTPVKKVHYIIHTDNPNDDIAKYENAITNYGKLDEYRFYNGRRIIRFQHSTVSIELYSAKELLDLYNKAISPFTIKDGQKYRNVEFAFTMDGKSVKPQLIK